jgi:hypothetical protein
MNETNFDHFANSFDAVRRRIPGNFLRRVI